MACCFSPCMAGSEAIRPKSFIFDFLCSGLDLSRALAYIFACVVPGFSMKMFLMRSGFLSFLRGTVGKTLLCVSLLKA